MRSILSLAVLSALFVPATPSLRALPVTEANGYLDVTTRGADPTGGKDSTAAIQAAIDEARDRELACFFPAGRYLISDRLACDRIETRGKEKPCILIGSVADPKRRATLVLAPKSPGFGDATKPRVVVHFINEADPVRGDKGHTRHYDQCFSGIDIVISEGNPGAVALRMQGAEGSIIQDTTIDLRASGHCGVWGIPGSGGSAHRVTVLGGDIGLDTRDFPGRRSTGQQPTGTASGMTLVNQRQFAVATMSRGVLVLVGADIRSEKPGPVILLGRASPNEPFQSSLAVVDSLIAYARPGNANVVMQMADEYSRSFVFENVHVRNAARIWSPETATRSDGWHHISRLALEVTPQPLVIGGRTQPVGESVYVDGVKAGRLFYRHEEGVEPPVDLLDRHRWPDDLPTFEHPGAVSVKQFGARGDGVTDDSEAIQRAVDAATIVFFPKGQYLVSRTIDLQPDSKLIGVHHWISRLHGEDSLERPFAGNTDPERIAFPMLRTADSAKAETYLGFLWIRMGVARADHDPAVIGHYALEWRSGPKSIVRACGIQPYRRTPYNPARVAEKLGWPEPDTTYPDDTVGQKIFPTKHPVVQIRGNGGGRWFNTWFHGGYMLREDNVAILAENTFQPLEFYHLHLQQQESRYHARFSGSRNISVYGAKCELKAGMIAFERCDNVRMIGHGGLGTPDPKHGYDHLYLFKDCSNFLISNVGDDLNVGQEPLWVGSPYYRWVNSPVGTYSAIAEEHGGKRLLVNPWERPILYQRGNPGPPWRN